MTIHATSRPTTAPADHASARDLRSDNDQAPEQFAGLFAGAVHASAPRHEPKKPEGTSELDPQDAKGDEKEDVKRASHHRRGASDASDASDGVATNPASDDVVQSTALLDPDMQSKLARVMSRMHDETGHDVTVAETYRSQGRQDALFAQGRQAPGPVVTWTHNSKHTQGRAVDLVLDGGTGGPDAYTALRRIANEEGLRTLGAKDPGHLELPGANGAAANDATSLIPVEPADASGPGQVSIARLAQVAQVAQVSVAKTAEVARVAPLARVATPGVAAKGATNSVVPNAPQAKHAAITTVQDASQPFARGSGGDASAEEQGDGGRSDQRGGSYSALAAAVALREASSFHSAIEGAGASTPTTAAERAAKLIAAFEDAPARPLSQITMSVDTGNGTSDRVQVALRGSSLNATIDAADAHGAQTMNSKSDELVRALSKDGIEVESLRVRAAAGTTAVGSSQSSGSSSDSSTNSRFERHNPWQQQDRQRSQDDRRQQQRNRRGGQEQ